MRSAAKRQCRTELSNKRASDTLSSSDGLADFRSGVRALVLNESSERDESSSRIKPSPGVLVIRRGT
jgi:hypothetical protein